MTDYRQNEKKITDCRQESRPLADNRPYGPTLWGYLYSEINRILFKINFFHFPFLSKVFRLICFKHIEGLLVSSISDQRYVNYFKFQFRYSKNLT